MQKSEENYIDHEVRMRCVEAGLNRLEGKIDHLEVKMDSHFKWMLGSMITLFAATILPLLGAVILHMAK